VKVLKNPKRLNEHELNELQEELSADFEMCHRTSERVKCTCTIPVKSQAKRNHWSFFLKICASTYPCVKVPEDPERLNDDELNELQEELSADFDIGYSIKDNIIPRAVEW
jgi:hypothetical protein